MPSDVGEKIPGILALALAAKAIERSLSWKYSPFPVKIFVDIIVKGSVGHMSGFMAQSGTLLICKDAGEALGDSIYETVIYVAGKTKSLGADCIEKKMNKTDIKKIEFLLEKGNIKKLKPNNFKKFGSSRKLYNFNVDKVSEY